MINNNTTVLGTGVYFKLIKDANNKELIIMSIISEPARFSIEKYMTVKEAKELQNMLHNIIEITDFVT